jgi:hypothetical protein
LRGGHDFDVRHGQSFRNHVPAESTLGAAARTNWHKNVLGPADVLY